MKTSLKVEDVLRETKGKLVIGNKEEICENFSFDTRNIIENGTFVGIKGERADGST